MWFMGSLDISPFDPRERPYLHLDETMRFLHTLGPVDAIVGFSQGAVLAHHLVREAEAHPDDAGLLRPRAVVLACGFPARCPSSWRGPLRTPSLHCYSESDATVPVEYARELAAAFAAPTKMEHDKGHSVPQRSAEVDAIIAFLVRHAAPA